MSIMRDVTEKRRMEQKLLRSEKNFRAIFEDAIEAILIWRHDGVIVNANAASSRTFELPLEELIGTNLQTFINKKIVTYGSFIINLLSRKRFGKSLPLYAKRRRKRA